jgi:inosose dehydratase
MLDITIGTAPVNWNNEDVPDYRPWTPYGRMLDEMAQAGYAGTEVTAEFPSDPGLVLADLAARRLVPASRFCSVNFRDRTLWDGEIARAVETARFLRALGVDVVILADSGDEARRAVAGRVTEREGLDLALRGNLAAGLEVTARRCLDEGVRVAFHNHVGTYVETVEELSLLLDNTDPDLVNLCLDFGHLLYGGGDYADVLANYGARIRYVHLKDVDTEVLTRSRIERLSFGDALRAGIFTEFGAGVMDFRAIFEALDRLDYRGWIIVEQDTTRRTPLDSATINREYLRSNFGL